MEITEHIRMTVRADGAERTSEGRETEDYRIITEKIGGRTRYILCPKRKITIMSASLRIPYVFDRRDQFFVNGYQSWTDTREYDWDEELHNMNRVPDKIKDRYHFPAYGDAWFRTYRKGDIHGFTFGYVRHADGTADLIGSYNEENAFLVILFRKRENCVVLQSDCSGRTVEERFTLFDFTADTGRPADVLRRYFAAYGNCGAPVIRGYTSWYNHYQDISEEKILRALDGTGRGHFDLFQIDDGYETYVGDWCSIDPQKFPNGLGHIVRKIHARHMKAGIWLAPFVCEAKSALYREHPDWLYRENGRPVFAGSNWSGDVVLDIRKEEVVNYIRDCLTFFKELGFDFFKLDFLYAAALIRDERMTRAEIMRKAMRMLRGFLPDRLILGCGVPLSSAFNLVEYCRIGPDVSLTFDDVFYMRFMHRERISTRQTLQNTIYRSCMDGTVFRCDPDVFILRKENNHLSDAQRFALTVLNHLLGAVYMTSDDISGYDRKKRRILARADALRDAEVTEIRKEGDRIHIFFTLWGRKKEFIYNRKKGVLMYGQNR